MALLLNFVCSSIVDRESVCDKSLFRVFGEFGRRRFQLKIIQFQPNNIKSGCWHHVTYINCYLTVNISYCLTIKTYCKLSTLITFIYCYIVILCLSRVTAHGRHVLLY